MGDDKTRRWLGLLRDIRPQTEDLLAALQAYRSGERKSAIMTGIAKSLSSADAARAAGYFAGPGCG